MFAIFCNQGQMTFQQVKTECGVEKWTPILVSRIESRVVVPCFDSVALARRFAQRNRPNKTWLFGCVNLTDENINLLRSRGFEIELLTFPKKMQNLDIEVMEFEPDREVEVIGK